MPIGIVFSLDYEIHGNGAGSPADLMVGPTWRLLRQLERFGAKLTIFAEVMEILRFREHFLTTGRDDFSYEPIVEQLRYAVTNGHDVQLHIHPSYAKANLTEAGWKQNWDEYDTAKLPAPRIKSIIAEAKGFLDEVLRPVRTDYEVYAFRAGNWAMMPTRNIADALVREGIKVDSSVFKGGTRNHVATFDYTAAHSAILPWRADPGNICLEDKSSPLWEYPIYCEMRSIWAFVSPNRFYRAFYTGRNRLGDGPSTQSAGRRGVAGKGARVVRAFLRRHPWKADFNQCTGRQLTAALKRVQAAHAEADFLVPFVTIGHSKTYNTYNERSLEAFLKFASAAPDVYRFALYKDFLPQGA